MKIDKISRESVASKLMLFFKRRFKAVLMWIQFLYLLLKYGLMKWLFRLFYSQKRKKNRVPTVLTFCMGGIGDIILATPFYTNLKSALPTCEIDIITFMSAQELLEKNFPLINRIIPYPINRNYMGLTMAWRFFRDLYIENYDYYFCVADYSCPPWIPHNLYGSVIGYVADIPKRVGIYRQYNTDLVLLEKKLMAFAFEKNLSSHNMAFRTVINT